MPAHWREDTLVAALLSAGGGDFLRRNADSLLANGAALLRQAVHLMRVTCKEGLPWEALGSKAEGFIFLPAGSGWGAAAELIERALPSFQVADLPFILGFLEDWCALLRWGIRYPPGSGEVACIARHWFMQAQCEGRRSPIRDFRERLLRVWLRIPLAAQPHFGQMVAEALARTDYERADENLFKMLYSHFDGDAVCRDLPDLAIQVIVRVLGLDVPSVEEKTRNGILSTLRNF